MTSTTTHHRLVRLSKKLWLVRLGVLLFAAAVTVAWVLLGLLYEYRSDLYFPAPNWGGYCERKAVGTALLEPINSWTSISYIVFSALILGTLAEYRFLIGAHNTTAENQAVLKDLVFKRMTKAASMWGRVRLLFYGAPFHISKETVSAMGLQDAAATKAETSSNKLVDSGIVRKSLDGPQKLIVSEPDVLNPGGDVIPMRSSTDAAVAIPIGPDDSGQGLTANETDETHKTTTDFALGEPPTPKQLRRAFKISVADFDPADMRLITADNKTDVYVVEMRWSFRTSIWLGLIYSFIGIELGFGSFLFHARFDTPSSYADFTGMWTLSAFAFAYAAARIRIPGAIGDHNDMYDNYASSKFFLFPFRSFRGLIFVIVFVVVFVGGYLLRALDTTDYTQELFAGFLGGAIVIEVAMVVVRLRHCTSASAGMSHNHILLLVLAFVIFGIAFLFWQLDTKRILCDPDSVFQGHGLWHFLTALAYYFLFAFYYSESSAVYINLEPSVMPILPPIVGGRVGPA